MGAHQAAVFPFLSSGDLRTPLTRVLTGAGFFVTYRAVMLLDANRDRPHTFVMNDTAELFGLVVVIVAVVAAYFLGGIPF